MLKKQGALWNEYHALHVCSTMLRSAIWESVGYDGKAVVLERVKGIAEEDQVSVAPLYRGLIKIDI
jgi:hypothetical protein